MQGAESKQSGIEPSEEKRLLSIDALNEEAWKLRYIDGKSSRALSVKALKKSREEEYARGQAYANLNLGVRHFLSSENKEALVLFTEAMEFFSQNKSETGYASTLLYTGNIYESFGDYELALKYCQNAYTSASEISYQEGMGEAQSVLGLIYSRLSDFNRALKSYKEGLRIREELGDQYAVASSLNRIARILTQKKHFKKALEYYNKSLEIRRELNQKGVISWTYLGLASTYEAMGDFDDAQHFYEKMLHSEERCLDDRCRLQALLGLGRIRYKTEQCEEAFKCFTEALELADKLEAKPLQVEAHFALADYYETAQQFEQALFHYKNYRRIREAVMNDETRNRLKNQQITFAIEKSEKEKEIFQLRNVELKAAYDEIHQKNKEITDSINYASRIQSALFPQKENLNRLFPEHFIMFLPRDVVSGDFYWAAEVGDKMVIAAADCTGHGVPGALMSMLGISFLNEIIADRKVTDPADILNDLRSEVVKALSQTGRDDEQKDGLDIALIVYEPATGRLEFAGAYNPLYVVSDGELVEYKGDRMPISYSDDMERSFSKTGIQLKTGDVLYMFSDGFADQFGGPGRKKFKYKPLKELLVRIHHEPMDRQQLLLYETFFDWKGDIEQIDDVVLVGIRI